MNQPDPETIDRAQIPDLLAVVADRIEANPKDASAIATGFRLLAIALTPCEDCGAATIHPDDNPAAGVHLADTAADPFPTLATGGA